MSMTQETIVNVIFWHEDKDIYSWWSDIYPNYKENDTIYLQARITPIGRDKYPSATELLLTKFTIKEVHHSLTKEYSNDIADFCKLDVYLLKNS